MQILEIFSRLAHEILARRSGNGVFSTSPPKRHKHLVSLYLSYDMSYETRVNSVLWVNWRCGFRLKLVTRTSTATPSDSFQVKNTATSIPQVTEVTLSDRHQKELAE